MRLDGIDSLVGGQIGSYTVVSPLGEGGMATVYRAFQARLNRYVALKMIHRAHTTDRHFLTRFEREAQIVAALDHPHIVPIFDYADHEGQPYLVMRLIEGGSLRELLREGMPTPASILTLMSPVASALDYAHAQGVLHRDIKPSNVLLNGAGTPFLSDFGLAKLAAAGETTISENMLIGTPHYISPEQAQGGVALDHRADLYSLGVILYQMIVGQVPFSAGTPYAIIHDHIYTPLPPPSSLDPAITPEVERVLMRALAKNPAERYHSAGELVGALGGALGVASAIPSAYPVQVNGSSSTTTPPAAYTPPRSGVRTPILPRSEEAISATPVQASVVPAPPARSRSGRIVLVILVIVTFLAVLVALNAMRRTTQTVAAATRAAVETLNGPIDADLTATAVAQASETAAQSLNLYDVPVMTLADAQAAVDANPTDARAYLALALAQIDELDYEDARITLTEGARYADDPYGYLLSAGNAAYESDFFEAAFTIYRDALGRLSETDDSPRFEQARALIGEQLYTAASTRRTIFPIGQPASGSPPVLPLFTAIEARVRLTNGNERLARISVNQALRANPDLAEAHLVNGDLAAAQGDMTTAQVEWQAAIDAPDAPVWVGEQARLLQSTASS